MWSDFKNVYNLFETCVLGTLNLAYFLWWNVSVLSYRAYITTIESEFYQRQALNALWLYCRAKVRTEDIAIYLYHEYPEIQKICEYVSWTQKQLHILTTNKRNEPDAKSWISVCTLSTSGEHYFETYEILNGDPVSNAVRFSMANAFSKNFDEEIADTIVIMKTDDKYKIQKYNENKEGVTNEPETFELSSYSILSATFINNDGKEIVLDIPSSMFLVGNQLLSPVFVCRCLAYQGLSHHFDMDYTICIIDKNVNCIAIKPNQYITIYESDCIVVSVDDSTEYDIVDKTTTTEIQ